VSREAFDDQEAEKGSQQDKGGIKPWFDWGKAVHGSLFHAEKLGGIIAVKPVSVGKLKNYLSFILSIGL
jgi:hypothetical protein